MARARSLAEFKKSFSDEESCAAFYLSSAGPMVLCVLAVASAAWLG
jgi:hypothetical protein